MGIKADEVEPAQGGGQLLGGNTAERPHTDSKSALRIRPSQINGLCATGYESLPSNQYQEAFDLLVAAVDRLDMEVAAHPLAGRLDQGFMPDAESGGGRREIAGPIGDEKDVGADSGSQHR